MYDVGVEVFQKCLEMSEIAAESRWMLRNVSEIVGSQIKKAVISNVPEHKDIRSFFGYAAKKKALRRIVKKLRLFALSEINFYFRV